LNVISYIAVDSGYNYWDNGNMGNYWWDYEEKYLDTKNDGIIYKKPYEIVLGNNQDNYPLLKPFGINSNPPEKPNDINGPRCALKNTDLSFKTSSVDSDGDEIYYLFDWGDNTNSGWVGPYDSGNIATVNKTYEKIGFKKIRVKAKDVYGFESKWSEAIRIIMPKEKQISKHTFTNFIKNISILLKNYIT
jgi:hypothetical protein